MTEAKIENRETSIEEFSTEELAQVSGGLNPQPLPPGIVAVQSIGSQTSGAGAGKISFDPF
jgi:hypothetical protein